MALAERLLVLTGLIPMSTARQLWNRSRVERRGLRDALNTMAPGHQRCMYCGDSEGTSVDHFEPIARNPMRTFDWLNHLLACSFCNSNQKGSRYPVDDAGRPLLIDPTVDDPFDHLMLSLSVGEYRARTPKGAATLDVLALNRAVLVRGRQHARDVVGQALRMWRSAQKVGDGREQARQIRTIRMQPLADVYHAMLRYALSDNAPLLFAGDADLITILRDPELRSSL
ncbi:HNH endonuclease [Allorhizocola rhizosphaerae]|uniref:HNH endonuclease n=1 Tax=Allorhizocola rhizosphaerae TaxID=1872709 RepID=UPI001B8AD295|nr:HNH endonuclease [Allorhizocola rhizosphaerae]